MSHRKIKSYLMNNSNLINRYILYIIYICLTTLTMLTYWDVQNHNFINFDDHKYIIENDNIKNGFSSESVKWTFTTNHVSNWHPVTWLSLIMDYSFYRLNPKGYHFNNLLIHLSNTLLLFYFLNNTTGSKWKSAFVSSLFSLHPLHVESVAWVSERKDVLSTFFWLLTMIVYSKYTKGNRIRNYTLVLLFMVLGLLTKPMVVTLPFVLLLLDFWPLNRFELNEGEKNHNILKTILLLMLEKIPFIILAVTSSILTVMVHHDSGNIEKSFPFIIRIQNAIISCAVYLTKMIWPANLSFFYPYRLDNITCINTILSATLLAAISILVIKYSVRYKYLLSGWLWYLITLLPVIGLVQTGQQAMADRYTYIPLTGIFILLSWGLTDISTQFRRGRIITVILSSMILLLLVFTTRIQAGYWKNSITLFEHAIEVTEQNDVAHNNLANAYAKKRLWEKAITHYKRGIEINPGNKLLYNNIANVLAEKGNIDEAINNYLKALELDPDFHQARYNLNTLLEEKVK